MAAYDDNRAAAVETVLEADNVATAVLSLMSKRTRWEGTATDLLSALNGETTEDVKREKKWPKDGRAVSGRLRRAAPGLRQIGITVERDREGKAARNRKITISRAAEVAENGGNFASASSAASAVPRNACEINNPEAEAKRTQTCGADANDAGADANDLDGDGRNPSENGGADGADDADANFPPFSEPQRVDP